MPKYLYVDHSQFIQGLPAADLESTQLSDAQRDTLQIAVGLGIYRLDTGPVIVTPAQNRVDDITEMVVGRGKPKSKDAAGSAAEDKETNEDTSKIR